MALIKWKAAVNGDWSTATDWSTGTVPTAADYAAINLVGNTEGDALRLALMHTQYDGVMGPFQFSPRRKPASAESVAVLVVKDGRFTVLE